MMESLKLHPSFWSILKHDEGDYGFYFQRENTSLISQLNVTETKDGLVYDYSLIEIKQIPGTWNMELEKFPWTQVFLFLTNYWHFPLVASITYMIGIYALT